MPRWLAGVKVVLRSKVSVSTPPWVAALTLAAGAKLKSQADKAALGFGRDSVGGARGQAGQKCQAGQADNARKDRQVP